MIKRLLKFTFYPVARTARTLAEAAQHIDEVRRQTQEGVAERERRSKLLAGEDSSDRFERIYAVNGWTEQALEQQARAVCRTKIACLFAVALGMVFSVASALVSPWWWMPILLLPACIVLGILGLANALKFGLWQAQIEHRRLMPMSEYFSRPDLFRHLFGMSAARLRKPPQGTAAGASDLVAVLAFALCAWGVLPADTSWAATAADAAQEAPGANWRIVLPDRLPAACFERAASDYALPVEMLLAIVKVESGGRPVVSRNRNGSYDVGVAQHNTGSWVPYFRDRYGISAEQLAHDVCQSVRAQAYTLRYELMSRECGGANVWCAVGRYHAPNNQQARQAYVGKVKVALMEMLASGRFEGSSVVSTRPRAR